MEFYENEYGSEDDQNENDLFYTEADQEGPESLGNSGQEEHEKMKEEKGDEGPEEKKEEKPKRRVLNPRITLNFDKLRGPNGLSALKKLFSNFKFKGHGHEQEDLTKIMGILQQWMCYQLFPSYDFETCMMQLENLGGKKNVQTLMKKYRLGIDDWGEKKSDSENNVGDDIQVQEEATKDKFDILLDCEIPGFDIENEFDLSDNEQSSREANTNNLQISQPQTETILTQEQLERIARNKKLAEERRLKRMNIQPEEMEVTRKLNEETELSINNP